jgi:DNA-binding PadR family transcriptional regulator
MPTDLPLTESTFFILLSLAPAPRHGYAIMKDVDALSAGRVTLSTGTLYGALGRLLDQGWIARVAPDMPDDSGRPRKEYTLTEQGRRILAAELDRLETVVAAARQRLAEEGL